MDWPAVLGNPGFAFDERERTWQWQQKFTVERGAHTFNFGADLLRADFQLDGGGNPDGNLTVRLNQFQLDQLAALNLGAALDVSDQIEERRVGKECIPPCRSRWSPYH